VLVEPDGLPTNLKDHGGAESHGRKVEVQEGKTRGFSFFRFILPG
jgi:hypothetical protein